MSTPVHDRTPALRFNRFFGRPIVGFLGTVASILGILLSIYLYVAARERPELTYFVHPAKAAIVRTGHSSQLVVTYGGETLSTNVTAAQVAFWNAGDRSIKRSDLLKPLRIFIQDGRRILEADVRKVSRDIVGLELDRSNLAAGELLVRWNIMEHDDGAVIQLLFEGEDGTEVAAEATLEGQRQVIRQQFRQKLQSPSEQYRQRVSSWYRPGYLLLSQGVILLGFWLNALRRDIRWRGHWFYLAIATVSLGAGAYEVIYATPAPPFGFD